MSNGSLTEDHTRKRTRVLNRYRTDMRLDEAVVLHRHKKGILKHLRRARETFLNIAPFKDNLRAGIRMGRVQLKLLALRFAPFGFDPVRGFWIGMKVRVQHRCVRLQRVVRISNYCQLIIVNFDRVCRFLRKLASVCRHSRDFFPHESHTIARQQRHILQPLAQQERRKLGGGDDGAHTRNFLGSGSIDRLDQSMRK
jgi:hypothetical protein